MTRYPALLSTCRARRRIPGWSSTTSTVGDERDSGIGTASK
jgi:hypothetical protein